MKLLPHWPDILRRAWSVRILGVLLLIDVLAAVISYLAEVSPSFLIVVLNAILGVLALGTRLLAQKNLPSWPAD